jgi:hypothetical protein
MVLVEVFILWHVRHAVWADGRPTQHRGDDGELVWNEEDGDDLKVLGVYSSEARAADRILRARQLPGFGDEPDCFHVDPHTVDHDGWVDGFVCIPRTDHG